MLSASQGWGGKQLQIQQSPCEKSTGRTCKRNEFSRCATFCHWQRRPCGEAQHRVPARQERLIPPQHPPLELDLFGAAGPAGMRTSWRFCIWGTGGLEAGNEAENSHLSIHMFESYPFLASSAACLCYPLCFPSCRLFGITGSWRGMCAQTEMWVSWYALQKILHSCSWGKGPACCSAKKPAYISSVAKVLNVWVKTLHLLFPALPGCGCALGFVSGGTESVPLEMGFVLVSLLVLPVGFCQQEAPFGLTTEVQEMFGNREKCLLVVDGGCSVQGWSDRTP